MKTKVLYFPSNTNQKYYDTYVLLKKRFDNLSTITVDEVEEYLNNINKKFYIKEFWYCLELYNPENECIFCINKPL
jgi:hypothetical protein